MLQEVPFLPHGRDRDASLYGRLVVSETSSLYFSLFYWVLHALYVGIFFHTYLTGEDRLKRGAKGALAPGVDPQGAPRRTVGNFAELAGQNFRALFLAF